METQQITVSLGERSYPIVIGRGLLSSELFLAKFLTQPQLFFVSNETVAPLYLNQVINHCSSKQRSQLILPDGEQFKTLASLELIFDKLMEEKFHRGAALCSLGGGVICDMTGFAAACYRRGIDYIQMPTTLLAQVDAAVGGKTAVNHPLGKNMIGAFYQPKAVLIDVNTLNTLPQREYAAGLAEVVKYSLIKDAKFFQWLEDNSDAILARDPKCLIPMIKHCCEIKAEIVGADERDLGIRSLLNFGHTFGHAIEAATGYTAWLHGEAVAIGMVAASFMSLKLNYINQEEYNNIINLLKKFNLPCSQTQVGNISILNRFMLQDKKIIDGSLKLILLKKMGEGFISNEFDEALLQEALHTISSEF